MTIPSLPAPRTRVFRRRWRAVSVAAIPLVVLLFACSGPDQVPSRSAPAGAPVELPDDDDSDRDGFTRAQEKKAGTDPQDIRSAPGWNTWWKGHPRLIMDRDGLERLRTSSLLKAGVGVALIKRLDLAANRSFREVKGGASYDPDAAVSNARLIKSLAFLAALRKDRALAQRGIGYLERVQATHSKLDFADLMRGAIHTSEALIMLCQAYDLLAGSGLVTAERLRGAADRIVGLALSTHHYFLVTNPMVLRIARNNNTIKFAAGLAYVGLLFNDRKETVPLLHRGMTDLAHILLEVQSTSDGGCPEGPYHLSYAADNYLPLLLAYRRVARGRTFPFWQSCTLRTGECRDGVIDLPDPSLSPRLRAIHEWWFRISLPDGQGPPIDDSNLHNFAGPLVALLHGDGTFRWSWDRRPDHPVPSSTEGSVETLLALMDGPAPVAPKWKPATLFTAAGNAVLRTGWDRDARYVLVLGESGKAHVNGMGHEHADPGAFMLAAFGEQLMIDGGYVRWEERDKVAGPGSHNMILVDDKGPPIAGGGDAKLSEWTEHEGYQAVTVNAGYGGTSIQRRFLLGRGEVLAVLDTCAAPEAHKYTNQYHGNAGGKAGGEFDQLPTGGLWKRANASVLVVSSSDGSSPTWTRAEAEHGHQWGEASSHVVRRLSASGSLVRFATLVVPLAKGAPTPEHGVLTMKNGAGVWTRGKNGGLNIAICSHGGAEGWSFTMPGTGTPAVRGWRDAWLRMDRLGRLVEFHSYGGTVTLLR